MVSTMFCYLLCFNMDQPNWDEACCHWYQLLLKPKSTPNDRTVIFIDIDNKARVFR